MSWRKTWMINDNEELIELTYEIRWLPRAGSRFLLHGLQGECWRGWDDRLSSKRYPPPISQRLCYKPRNPSQLRPFSPPPSPTFSFSFSHTQTPNCFSLSLSLKNKCTLCCMSCRRICVVLRWMICNIYDEKLFGVMRLMDLLIGLLLNLYITKHYWYLFVKLVDIL